MTRPAPVLRNLQAELADDVLRVERTAYRSGWQYGVLCGLLCGSMTTGLALLLLYLAASAWADAAAYPLAVLPALTT